MTDCCWPPGLTAHPRLFPQLLQQSLEISFYCRQVSWEEVSPNDAAALLKKFIRELPSPLLTAEHLNTFSAVKGEPLCVCVSLVVCPMKFHSFSRHDV